MDKVDLPADTRTELGSRVSRRLRLSGRLPVNLYGHQQEAQSLHVDARAFGDALRHHVRLLTLKVGGDAQAAVIHDLQYDPLSREVIHADLVRVNLDEKVEVPVPIKIHGPSKGELEGGILMELSNEVLVSCLPTAIPEEIEVDVRELNVGQAIHLRDLVAPEGIEFAGDPEQALITIAEPRYAAEEEEGEGEGEEEGEATDGEAAKPEADGDDS